MIPHLPQILSPFKKQNISFVNKSTHQYHFESSKTRTDNQIHHNQSKIATNLSQMKTMQETNFKDIFLVGDDENRALLSSGRQISQSSQNVLKHVHVHHKVESTSVFYDVFTQSKHNQHILKHLLKRISNLDGNLDSSISTLKQIQNVQQSLFYTISK